MLPSLALTLMLLVSICQHNGALISGQAKENRFYNIPNPFVDKKTIYSIRSFQSVISNHGTRQQMEVEESFSLKSGLSYSLHKMREESSTKPEHSFAIIGDGPRGKMYILREPEAADLSAPEVDCELDHLHQHKHVFPWLYEFDFEADEYYRQRMELRNGGKWANKRFIYGVGAIWLNAIERQLKSSSVGDDSPYQSSNMWKMEEGDLDVTFLFEKDPNADHLSDAQFAESIANSNLSSIQMIRRNVLAPDHHEDATSSMLSESSHINVREVSTKLNKKSAKRFDLMLKRCRANNRKHRVFPSAMKSMALWPNRLITINYIKRLYWRELKEPSGQFDELQHRKLWELEHVREWFSLKHEAQSVSYMGANTDSAEDERRVDVFMRRFTERENSRSSRHSTVSYHLVESQGLEVSSCAVESEARPSDRMMIRRIHFHRDSGKRITAHLFGLSALLLNAAEVHHKEFSLIKRELSIPLDPTDSSPESEHAVIEVDEWQFLDRKSGRSYHFYFRSLESEFEQHKISDLVRVDVRDSKAVQMVDRALDSPNSEDDFDMLIRFEVFLVGTENDERDVKFAFTVPEICKQGHSPSSDHSGDDASDDDDESGYETGYNSDEADYESAEGSDNGDDGDSEYQREGEEFEFEPGKLIESLQMPDFYEKLDGRSGYRIISRLELFDSLEGLDVKNRAKPFVFMKEEFELEKNRAILSVYLKETGIELSDNSEPDFVYYINYNSELIFEKISRSECNHVREVNQTWLRLFSAHIAYFRHPTGMMSSLTPESLLSAESYNIPLYGVGALWREADSSLYTDFVGIKRDNIIIDTREGHKGKFREVLWSLSDVVDDSMRFVFKFHFNEQLADEDKTANRSGRPAADLLELKSIYLDKLMAGRGDELSKFPRFNLDVLSLEPLMFDEQLWKLPSSCQDAELEASTAESPPSRDFFYNKKFPSFCRYLSNRGGSVLDSFYTIKHALTSEQQDEAGIASGSLTVAEHYDSKDKLSRLVIGNGKYTREIYIDGQHEATYAYMSAQDTCKRIINLKPLVDLGPNFLSEQMDYSKPIGLAAIWARLSELKEDVYLEVSHRLNNDGKKVQLNTYTIYGSSWNGQQQQSGLSYDIEAVFVADSEAPASEDHLKLESIKIIPEGPEWSPEAQDVRHQTIIQVQSIQTLQRVEWQLPSSCQALAIEPAEVDFPKMTTMFSHIDRFYMRSELTSLLQLDETAWHHLVLMDEWLNENALRFKTSHQGKFNLDLLLYFNTDESFDLSTAYRCSHRLPKLRHEASSTSDDHNEEFKPFWQNLKMKKEEASMANPAAEAPYSLADLYFSPVSLWRLAEESQLVKLELVTNLELAPKPKHSGQVDPELELELELRREAWQVSARDWKYMLHFSKVTLANSVKEWHVLDRIELTDPFYKFTDERKARIEIIDFNYQFSDHEMFDKFLLPEGYGCHRGDDMNAHLMLEVDDLSVSLDHEHWIWYEASLERIDKTEEDPELGSLVLGKTVLPTLAGTLSQTVELRSYDFYIDIFAHEFRTRFPNGTLKASKAVYDSADRLLYLIDTLTGFCRTGYSEQYEWSLEFPGEERIERVELSMELFEMLFKDTLSQAYIPINRYRLDEIDYSVYEKQWDRLKVLDSFPETPVSVIRSYQHPAAAPKSTLKDNKNGVTTRQYDGLTSKVLIFDESRTRVEASLSMSIRAGNTELAEIIGTTNVADCYNNEAQWSRRLGLFVFDYQLDEALMEWANQNRRKVLNDFTTRLIKDVHIKILQLNGAPWIEFDEPKRLMKIRLNLFDSSTAIEHFKKRYNCSMTEALEANAEMRLLPSLKHCSAWCDQLKCVAMSYCSDNICRLVTSNMLPKSEPQIEQILHCDKDDKCAYFFLLTARPKGLRKFANSMRASMASIKDIRRLSNLSLEIGDIRVEPTGFSDESSDFDESDADSGREKLSDHENGIAFRLFKPGFEIANSDQDKKEEPLTKQVHHAKSRAECLRMCKASGCRIASFCQIAESCTWIEGSKVLDLHAIEQHVERSKGCNVFAHDYLLDYTRFDNTRAPEKSLKRLDGYSAIECASACMMETGSSGDKVPSCLSFDYCTSLKDTYKNFCLLQSSHVMSDEFDMTLIEQRIEGNEKEANERFEGEKVYCEHYSKLVTADYEKIANRRLKRVQNSLLRGANYERCALDCNEKEDCWAFEYCFNDKKRPAEACYFITTGELERTEGWIEQSLIKSRKCSVYALKPEAAKANLMLESGGGSLALGSDEQTSLDWLHYSLIGLCYLAGAIVIGSLVQYGYMKLIGQPLLFNR